MNASRSACHCLVRRVITDELSPAAEPKNPSNAGTKSPELMPCRYMSGNTSATFGLLRHHGGLIELNRARARRDRAPPGAPVAHHQPPTVLVSLIGVRLDVGGYLGLQRGGQHPPGALPHDLIQHRPRLVVARRLIGHYAQHRRSFLAGVPAPANLVLVQRGRYVAPS